MRTNYDHPARYGAVEEARQGNFFDCVKLTDESGDFDNYCGQNEVDEDGDSIVARAVTVFRCETCVPPEFRFEKGTDREYLCGLLRKFIEVLEGPEGQELVNMPDELRNLDRACRRSDGTVVPFNCNERDEELREMQRKKSSHGTRGSSARRKQR